MWKKIRIFLFVFHGLLTQQGAFWSGILGIQEMSEEYTPYANFLIAAASAGFFVLSSLVTFWTVDTAAEMARQEDE